MNVEESSVPAAPRPGYPVRQPNGLYAVYTPTWGAFTAVNLSREMAYAEMVEVHGAAAAAPAMAAADRDDPTPEHAPDAPHGRRRWEGALRAAALGRGVLHGGPHCIPADEARQAGEAPPPRPGVKVTLGWMVARDYPKGDATVREYLGLRTAPDLLDLHGLWGERADAVRLPQHQARALVRGLLRQREDVRVVRLWRWVATAAEGGALRAAAQRVAEEWRKPDAMAGGPHLCGALDNLAAEVDPTG